MQRSNRIKHKSMLSRFMKGAAGFFALTVFASVMVTVLDAVFPQVIRYTVDTLINGQEPTKAVGFFASLFGGADFLRNNLWMIALIVVITALLTSFFRYLTRVANARGSETMAENMRNTLFSHIQKLPFSWHTKNQTGDIIQRCTSDVDTFRNFISEQLVDMFRIVFLIVFSLFMMFSMNVTLALIALGFVPVILFYNNYFRHRIRDKFTEVDEQEGLLSAMAQENLTGVRVVRAFGREKFEKDKFNKQNEKYTGLWVQLGNILGWFWGIGDLISCLQVMLILCIGTVFAVRGSITPGELIAFISYNGMLVWPVRRLGRIISEMSKAHVSIDRLRYIMDSEEETDRPDAAEPDMTGDIVFENVSFSYKPEKQVLKNVSFEVKAGTTLGILGATGSGKSTLILLLDRLYTLAPDCGRITIGGVDIADIKASWLRKNVGVVLQEPFLFSRSIGENIAVTDAYADEERVELAASVACISQDVAEMTHGYETVVGERGVTLSGGQKQRVAIARTLMLDTPIVVFDDSLSAVDTDTDRRIRKALRENTENKTVILISHRIVSLMEADKILVLDKGRVAQLGTHEELVAADGIYKRIYEAQSAITEEGRA
ncbi:MAG: ABC transporter ATP-binding protein [Lachnospiraceae bacterium]|nr:ABC transporter ATP-binding protein [Lachnospiraceae bacterium]